MCSLRIIAGVVLGVALSFATISAATAQDAGGMDLDIIKDAPERWTDPNAPPGSAGDANPLAKDFESALESYRDRDYDAAREKWGELTDAGHGLSMHNLAVLKWRGQGGPREREQALELFRDAGQKDVPESLHALGVVYLKGAGVPPDAHEAVRYFEAADGLDHPPSTYNLALAHLKGIGGADDKERGMALMRNAAEAGLARAQYDLGTLLYQGTYGPADKKAARIWFERAAENGDAFGYYNLSLMQFAGEGGGKDHERAVVNLTEAAEMGAVPAQVRLAHLLATGEGGVAKDPAGAYVWFTVAGAFGADDALENAKRISRTLSETQLKRARQTAAAFRPKRPPVAEDNTDAPEKTADAPDMTIQTVPGGQPAAPTEKDAKAADDLLKSLEK